MNLSSTNRQSLKSGNSSDKTEWEFHQTILENVLLGTRQYNKIKVCIKVEQHRNHLEKLHICRKVYGCMCSYCSFTLLVNAHFDGKLNLQSLG